MCHVKARYLTDLINHLSIRKCHPNGLKSVAKMYIEFVSVTRGTTQKMCHD